MKKLMSLLLLLCVALVANAKVEHLLPTPRSVVETGSPFALSQTVRIVNEPGWDCALLNEVVADSKELGMTVSSSGSATITVRQVTASALGATSEPSLADYAPEAYRLTVNGSNILIEAVSRVGVIRAAQTLQQLAEDEGGRVSALEGVKITDWPAFKVRGFMHDVGRSFIAIDELEKQIKLYSRYKVNTFQWHMTENQAWRFEVKNTAENASIGFDFSRLTDATYMTRFKGDFYSQADCRRLDEIAYKYGVTIIPELDMPGHSAAFKRATGNVDMQSDKGVQILTEALKQCCDVFTHSPYIHIGGDEVAITYSNFLNIMSQVVRDKNRRTVWWNTCAGVGTTHKLVDPSSDKCDMAQCWASSGTKISNLPCIDCRFNYTNHFDVFADLVGIYRSSILGDQDGNNGTAGFISCPWNDRKTPNQEDIIEQNNVYAVTIASGERAWKGGGRNYIDSAGGGAYLPNNGDDYNEFCDWERRFLFHKAHSLKDEPIPYVKQTNVRWRVSAPVSNGNNKNAVFDEWESKKDLDQDMPSVVTRDGKKYGWTLATGAGIYLNHTWGSQTVAGIWGKKAQGFGQTAYAYTYIYNEQGDRTVGAQIEFQNYGRSENDPAPSNGNWDLKGSNIWWNGTAITPPTWGNNGGGGGNPETPLLNENFPAREPIQLTLKQGWNKVFIKLPYVDTSCRLDKWMFTFVLTDINGKNAIEGVTYSPFKTLGGAEAESLMGVIDNYESEILNMVGSGLGYYPESVATDVLKALADCRTAAAEETPNYEQIQSDAETAYNNFMSGLSSKSVNQPATNAAGAQKNHWYTFKDKRGNKYMQATGAAAGMTGNTTLATDGAAYWKLVDLGNGRVDIVNYKFDCHVANTAGNNQQLTTAATAPTTGWTITYSGKPGYFIISSGSAQIHQSNSANVLNWGGGSKTEDDGCLFELVEVNVDEPMPGFHVESNLSVGGVKYNSENITNGAVVRTSATEIAESAVEAINVSGYDAKVTILNNDRTIKVVYTIKEGNYFLKTAFSGGQKYGVVASGNTLKLTTEDATPSIFKIRPTGKTNSSVNQPTYYITNAEGTSYLTYDANLGGQTEVLILDKNAVGVTWENNATPADGFCAIVPLSGNSNRALGGKPSANLGYGTRALPNVYYGQSNTANYSYSWVVERFYTISYTGLKESEVGGVTYNRVNYTGATLAFAGDLDTEALIAMHVSGYNGTVSVDHDNKTITVSYSSEATAGPTLWPDNNNSSKLPAARIPAIVKSQDYILAFSDWRYNRNDIGRGDNGKRIDIEMRRSHDNGQTWEPAIIVAQGTGNTADGYAAAFGDAAVVADRESGKVLMMAAAGNTTDFTGSTRTNPIKIGKFVSSDNGATWQKSEVTTTFYDLLPQSVTKIFVTSGKMLQGSVKKANAENYRIYAVLCTNEGNHVVYSDDFGANWARLGNACTAGNEAHVTELPNGDLLLDSRANGARYVNVYTYTNKDANGMAVLGSDDTQGSWGTHATMGVPTSSDGCNGDINIMDAYRSGSSEAVKVLVQTSPRSGRNNVSYYYMRLPEPTNGKYNVSDFAGASKWTSGYEVFHGASAYTSIFSDGEGNSHIFYEKNTTGSTWSYNMTYEKHNISDITKGAYLDHASEGLTVNYTLTDANGQTYSGSCQGVEGTAPTFTGAHGYTLSNEHWGTLANNSVTYTAKINFPFPVSSNNVSKWVNLIYMPNFDRYISYDGTNDKMRQAYKTGGSNDPGTDKDKTNYIWSVIPVLEEGSNNFGFKLYSKGAGKYVSANGMAHQAQVALANEGDVFSLIAPTATPANATHKATNKGVFVKTVGENTFSICVESATSKDFLTFWNTQTSSHAGQNLDIAAAYDMQEYDELLAKVQSAGTHLGEYHIDVEGADAKVADCVNNRGDMTKYYDHIADMKDMASHFSLNMPKAGQFLRMKGVVNTNKYITEGGNNGKYTMGTDQKNSIFYFDGHHLLNYSTGLYMGVDGKDWKWADPGTTGTEVTFHDASTQGAYRIQVSQGGGNMPYVFLFSGAQNAGNVDRGGFNSVASCTDTKYQWILEEVTELPVTIGETGFATFYTPVTLALPEAITAYVSRLDGENLAMYTCKQETSVDGSVCYAIPANTAVMLKGATGNLTIVEDENVEEYHNNAFFGSVATLPFDSDNNYYSLQKDNANQGKVGFFIKPSGNFKGFQAFLQTDKATLIQRFNVTFDGEEQTTGIIDANGTLITDTPAFDLTGRRVASGVKGISILGGKKVIR